jgi:tetratricopeptide (TPR) repeat protein
MKRFAVILIISCFLPLVILCAGKKVDPGASARMYGARASQLFNEGNLAGAIKEYRKAYAAAARMDLPLLQAQYLFNIGRAWYELGILDSAGTAFEAAYREFNFYKDMHNACIAAGFMALVYCRSGMYDSAFAWYKTGRPQHLQKGNEPAFWLTVQALISLLQNRIPEASAWLDRAYESYKKDKSWNGMAQIDYYRALIAYRQGNRSHTKALLASSLASLDMAPERYRRWRVLLASAMVSFCLNDTQAAERFYRRALDCAPRAIELPQPDYVQSCPEEFWDGAK